MICKKIPKTQTTYNRNITTLSGNIKISFKKKYCEDHGLINTEIQSLVQRICPKRKSFDTKVMIAIGFLRWLFDYQREEIQLLLEARGVRISTGEISEQSEEFLLRFYVIHKKHYLHIKKFFIKNGGYVLHLDGSAESGDEITFTAKDGITGFTIDSWIMPSESREYIIPFLKMLKKNYGTPLAVVRDMSDEIAFSVSDIFSHIAQQVCHYHFVKNLGDITFKNRYEDFRKVMLKTKILANIHSLKKSCPEEISTFEKILRAEHYWVMIAIEYVLYPRERKSDYPFVLPYAVVMDRLIEVSKMIKKIIMWNARHNKAFWIVLKFEGYLKKLADAKEVIDLYSEIKQSWEWFEEIRTVLRVSREFSEKEQDHLPTKIDEIKPKFMDTILKIRKKGQKLGGQFINISKKICENCEKHLEELFVKVNDKDGHEIKIIRHNGLEELNHRWSRMHIRRRTGRSRTTMEMEKYGALFAVFSNIEYEDYIKNVLFDVNDFVREMQNITEEEVLEARKLIRTFPQSPIIRFDSERPVILRKFIEFMEDEFEDISDADIDDWIKTFEQMTD